MRPASRAPLRCGRRVTPHPQLVIRRSGGFFHVDHTPVHRHHVTLLEVALAAVSTRPLGVYHVHNPVVDSETDLIFCSPNRRSKYVFCYQFYPGRRIAPA